MTTIAYKDGIVAYDSRTSAGSVITNDNADKHYERNGVHFFMCGTLADYEAFFAAFEGAKPEIDPDVNCLALIDGKAFICGYEAGKGVWRSPIDMAQSYAIGSGSEFAWGAMDCGASAYQAIEIAAKRDAGTGGKIRVYQVSAEGANA